MSARERLARAAVCLNTAPVPPEDDPCHWSVSDEAAAYCDGCGKPTGAPCLVSGGGASGGYALCLACAEGAADA